MVKTTNLETKLGHLARSREHLGDCFLDLGRDLSKMGENQKNDDSSLLLKVFLHLGALSEAMLAHLGAMLGRLGAILEQLGDKMWLESAKMSQDSGQERQDEARWRKWAVRERLGPSGG